MPSKIERLTKCDDLPERLADELARGGADLRDGVHFAPELSFGRHFGPAPADARAAAVIALLFPRDGVWHIPLTVRHAALGRHGGQISLPGGSVDAGETTADAAQRELAEELGVVDHVRLLGELPESYVYVSNFRVTPWLAATHVEPVWRPHDREVERVVEVPLTTFIDATCLGMTTIERGPVKFSAPCYWIGSDCVWGATSIILGQLSGLLRKISEDATRDD
jgi:8-oxo-dGTP pyrophosphatase MutT (NUDIX family)